MIGKPSLIILIALLATNALAQTNPPASRAQVPGPQSQSAAQFELSAYGVSMQPDTRLIIMMASLQAAGFAPAPTGKKASPLRLLTIKDLRAAHPDAREAW